MRKICLGAFIALFAVACTRAAEPPAAPSAPASTIEPSAALQALRGQERDTLGEQRAACPRLWTCEYVGWYETRQACTATCSSTCFLEYYCSGNCVCP